MLIIPAIDIKEGKVVRLIQGRYNKKIYSENPIEVALHWQREGAEILHIVDLDGAQSGEVKNLFWLLKILGKIDIPVQFGGGLRDIKTIKKILEKGVFRAIVGTKAEDRDFLKKVFKYFGRRVIVSVDERRGSLMKEGWLRSSKSKDVNSLLEMIKDIGFREIIYTDIMRDGTLKGPNIKRIEKILKSGIKIIVSGGVSSLEDIQKLKPLERYGLEGVIVGKALYEGRFRLKEAIKLVND